jgi:hypothetical protein
LATESPGSFPGSQAEPYLSVVVTTRNDDHGGDPLKRLQAFVNTFDAQCRRTGLDAEVIVVEWNPPADRPRVSSMLRLPADPCCAYRFIDVPPELHNHLRYADVLPLFQMIAKNVGVRRARGQFVLATNIDIIFSTELIEHIAERRLQRGRLYRTDRHDIQSNIPIDAPLDVQMAYCQSHQLRVHTRWGTYPVDPQGHRVSLPEDVVDGRTVRLGAGWHVREGSGTGGLFRWASDRAELLLCPEAGQIDGPAVLDLDVEANPYDPASWTEVTAVEGDHTLVRARFAGSTRLRVELDAAHGERRIVLRVVDTCPEARRHLPVFERRDAMHYRLRAARLRAASLGPASIRYPMDRWMNANRESQLRMYATSEGIEVNSDPAKCSYCARYGPLCAPSRGTFEFELTCDVLEGDVAVGILSGGDEAWIPASVTIAHAPIAPRRFQIAVDLQVNEVFSVMVTNNHPHVHGASRFVIRDLRGPAAVLAAAPAGPRIPAHPGLQRGNWASSTLLASAWRTRTRSHRLWRLWMSFAADSAARLIARAVGKGVVYRIARAAPEFGALESALRESDRQLRELAPLGDLAGFHTLMRDFRPDNLHVNGCGDFQLMAREHWEELRGYPELETFSMNIDGLLSYIADAAGIREQTLPMPIYHLEHEVGSGWSPEGEALLRRRIAERGITWLDASTVYIWAAYMRWLGRPMIFNDSSWGLADRRLPQTVHAPATSTPSP